MSPARGVVLTDLQSSLIVNNFSLSLSLSSVGTEEALLVVALLLLVVALLHKHEAHLVLPLCYRCVTAVFARLVFYRLHVWCLTATSCVSAMFFPGGLEARDRL